MAYTVTRATSGKYINRFLSTEAVEAKQKRRQLERCWKSTGADSDRRAELLASVELRTV